MSATAEQIEQDIEDQIVFDEELLQLTYGQIIQKMVDIRDERALLSKRDKELVQLWRMFEARLIQLCDEQGMKRMSSDLATATVTSEVLPQLEDFDELWLYMKENDAPHLLQRRVSSSAYRELQDAGIEVPGVTPYVQRKISLRKR